MYGEQDRADLEGWRPVACETCYELICKIGEIVENGDVRTFEDIKTDTSQLVNVGMVDLGQKSDLGWRHWVVVWQEELELEDTACPSLVMVRTVSRPRFDFALALVHMPSYGDCVGPWIMTSK